MKHTQLFFLGLFLFLLQSVFSQNFSRVNDWKKYRKEVQVQVGASGFLGDLGGLDRIGTNFSPVDLELALTRPAISVAYRYKFSKFFNIHSSLNYLLVAGDDKLTKEQFRHNRNLNFKSNIFEAATRFEFSLYSSHVGHRYGIKKTLSRRHKGNSKEFIFFVGAGVFYFNPKGTNAAGVNQQLYLLHTEGQGLDGGPKQYKRVAISIPMGVAYKVVINKLWSAGFEVNYRKTFTDYIDDVSGTYYPNKAVQLAAYGTKSLAFADPSLGDIPLATAPNGDGTGAQRGDLQKDAFLGVQVTVGRFFPPKRKKTRLRSKF
jgi:hypothetical protein